MSFWNPNSLHYVIDWSAWATLVVGISAVIGAVLIGKKQAAIALMQAGISDRQARIMERQTEIASRQADTEHTRLRAELYDRRVIVYAGIERYLIDASMDDGKVSNEVRQSLFNSISVSSFLLDDDVASLGRKILRVSSSLRSNMRKLEKLTDEALRDEIYERIDLNNDELTFCHTELRNHMTRYLKLGISSDTVSDPE
ncbi:hypothetical protein [Sphingomonas sp. BK481]|uniref:hypothetical protein n=1 Tax=Sphingomonas sp. BK481 TaxID=2586981 RepID=UPI001613BEE7|nr:hypothetical protein [Sphingomonas sp. BK481]